MKKSDTYKRSKEDKFINEITIVRMLDHPNILKVYEL